jgi:outer membrane biosynthesis protein TonB
VTPRGPRPTRRPLVLSVGLHALVITVLLWVAEPPEPMVFESFKIELVSPPPEPAREEMPSPVEALVIERPDPEPESPAQELPPPPEDTAPPPEDDPLPEPEPEVEVEDNPPPPAEEADPATTETDEDPVEESGEDVNVRLEGLQRDYPAYYDNIIRQIDRCFRPPRGSFSTTVYFEIRRDGTVSSLRFVERSGDQAFDLEALGAVECAGQGRFGPLPEDLPYDVLPVQFNFRPRGLEGLGVITEASPTKMSR